MILKKISIEKIPSYGPYSTCVLVDNFLFVSGQIAIDFKTGKLVFDSIEIETRKIMENLKFILKENGLHFKNVIKTSIFVKNMNHFSKINEVYSEFFHKNDFPARETIQISGLPKNANIEISLIAYKN
ncbi:Rid family detoxifying hydrolase [Blattabacterium cuenoti]|uniref:Rid family detoxifying hydrolase n=1 Tax=Blattabacterium cuenoti TaxID=1653831 RepID=UPI00163C3007|nr:Rid family detoxifying hydrolase [Blattabacterium cuenoti]